MQTIETAPLNDAANEWGVAVMSVQANIPNPLPGQAVSFILLGDVNLENAVPPDQAVQPADVPIPVTTINASNVRALPTTVSNVVGSVQGGVQLSADAINPDKNWVRVVYADQTPGWIRRDLVSTDGDLDSLPVFTRTSQTPMQAFYFRTGIGQPSCNQSPDVLVVQGPEQATVNITANGANIRISSTIALRTTANNQLQIYTLSGEAEINGIIVPAGYTAIFQLSEDGKIVGELLEGPRPLTQEELDELQWLEGIPLDVLNYPIVIRDALPKQQIVVNVPGNGNTGPSSKVDCSKFKATSPLDGLAYGTNVFYWDAAPGATSYVVNVEGAGAKEIAAPDTFVTFDISSAGFDPQMTWSVQALYNGSVVCSSQAVTIPREWAPPPPSGGVAAAFSASWTCSGGGFTVNYAGLPAGPATVTINYVISGGTSFPFPPVSTPVPPDPGSWPISAFPNPFTLTNGFITANPSGAGVSLPDLTC
ncbi:MAG: SH3 domain-containing protein [Anaerolineae bacterium]